jgi:hypothetical protein
MQGQAAPESTKPLMIIVPRAQATLSTALHRAFQHDATVEVTVDRRVTERRSVAETVHRQRERRRRPEVHPDLTAGRWIVVARTSRAIDVVDARMRAILFLCCSHHAIPCQQCQNTYRLGWLQRLDAAHFACPLCRNDLTETVLAHADGCQNFS